MPDSDPDRERRDPRFDNWPVERYDDRPDERATPREKDGTTERVAESYEAQDSDLEWIGVTGPGIEAGTPYVYAGNEPAIYEGELDQEDARVVIREEGRRTLESEESIGEHLEEIGEDHGWHWLSSFAREYLEDDEADERTRDDGLALRDSEFTRSELPDSSSADMSFNGSHTLDDPSGRVHIIDRRFTVTDTGAESVRVDVAEYFMVGAEPRETERAGDSEPVEEREYSFDLQIDPDTPNREAAVEEELMEWHESRIEWPAGE